MNPSQFRVARKLIKNKKTLQRAALVVLLGLRDAMGEGVPSKLDAILLQMKSRK